MGVNQIDSNCKSLYLLAWLFYNHFLFYIKQIKIHRFTFESIIATSKTEDKILRTQDMYKIDSITIRNIQRVSSLYNLVMQH